MSSTAVLWVVAWFTEERAKSSRLNLARAQLDVQRSADGFTLEELSQRQTEAYQARNGAALFSAVAYLATAWAIFSPFFA